MTAILDGTDFYIIHITALTAILLSAIGSCWILINALLTARKNPGTFADIGSRLPIYLSILDLCFAAWHSSDHLYLVIHQQVPSACIAMGILLQLFMGSQMTMIGWIAVTTYLRVCREFDIKYGAYDWRLVVLVFGLAAIPVIVAGSIGAFGPDKYWCLYDRDKDSGKALYLTMCVLVVVIYLVC